MDELLVTAQTAARCAGEYLRNQRQRKAAAECGRDIKLDADRDCEQIILEELEKTGLPVLSEEAGAQGELSGKYWVVDPLDGSMNYLRGMDELTCISIALMEEDMPLLGVVYRWKEEELFWGSEKEGAFCNGYKISVSSVKKTGQAVLATGFPVFRDYGEESLRTFVKQVQTFKKIRMLGAAAVMGSFVAAGRVDAYMEENIMLWDVAAAAALVKAAGGEVTLTTGPDYRCNCRFFANTDLMEDYYAAVL